MNVGHSLSGEFVRAVERIGIRRVGVVRANLRDGEIQLD